MGDQGWMRRLRVKEREVACRQGVVACVIWRLQGSMSFVARALKAGSREAASLDTRPAWEQEGYTTIVCMYVHR